MKRKKPGGGRPNVKLGYNLVAVRGEKRGCEGGGEGEGGQPGGDLGVEEVGG